MSHPERFDHPNVQAPSQRSTTAPPGDPQWGHPSVDQHNRSFQPQSRQAGPAYEYEGRPAGGVAAQDDPWRDYGREGMGPGELSFQEYGDSSVDQDAQAHYDSMGDHAMPFQASAAGYGGSGRGGAPLPVHVESSMYADMYSSAPSSGSSISALSYAPTSSYQSSPVVYASQAPPAAVQYGQPLAMSSSSAPSQYAHVDPHYPNRHPPTSAGHQNSTYQAQPGVYAAHDQFQSVMYSAPDVPADGLDPERDLANFFGLPQSGSQVNSEASSQQLLDSLMPYEDASGFDISPGGSGFQATPDEALYFGSSPATQGGPRYHYVLDPSLPPPSSSHPPTPTSSSGSSLFTSPYPGTHSLPPSTVSSPHESPRTHVSQLPVHPSYSHPPSASLPSPSVFQSAQNMIPFPPSPTSTSNSISPTTPFSPVSTYSPKGAPPTRIASRSTPSSRTTSFTHLPSYSPYPISSPRPSLHHRSSSSISSSSSIHRTPNSGSPTSFARPSPSVFQSPTIPLPTTLFDTKPAPRLRQSVSFPSPASALHHRRTQSSASRGVGSHGRRESGEGLNGLGFSMDENSGAQWRGDGSGRTNSAPHQPSSSLFASDEQAWGGPIEVRRVGEQMDEMTLDPTEDDDPGVQMERGEGTVVLVRGNEALETATKDYLNAPNRLAEGERALLILAPRIAQRSYGNEKRFLCPQPMTLLLGASWWSNIEDAEGEDGAVEPSRINLPPQINLAISSDPNPSLEPLVTDWMDENGDLITSSNEEPMPLSGRATGKSNYVPAGESGKDKKNPVRPLVTIHAPGPMSKEARLIGTFPGKAMHIISKPSKGKVTESSKTCLVHGDLVSLYNRTKAQTASTRFLGVSGNHSSFPTMDWRAMTGGQPRPFAPTDIHSTTFVARTGKWDAFVLYAVDLSLPTLDAGMVPAPAPYSGYPRPPVNAIPFDALHEKKIYYNMPVVLQCLSTAVVSPVMIIRKVDAQRTAIGGGSTSGYSSTAAAQQLPCAPGERLGEAVAQFRPIALEIYTDPNKARSGDPSAHPPAENTFLACLGDTIGINQSREVRRYFQPSVDSDSPKSPVTPITPISPGPQYPNFPTPSEYSYDDEPLSSPSKTKRVRRMSSNTSVSHAPYALSPPARTPQPKKRGHSLSNLTLLNDPALDDEPGPGVWSIDCGDPCVWTVVAIDLARHTFHIPPTVTGGKISSLSPPPLNCSPLFKTPVPSYPISPQIPVVLDYDPPKRRAGPHDTGAEEDLMITLHGENFSSSFTVWLGSSPCTRQMHKSPYRLLVSPPLRAPDIIDPERGPADSALRISFVRNDGVIFPSYLFYRDAH